MWDAHERFPEAIILSTILGIFATRKFREVDESFSASRKLGHKQRQLAVPLALR